MPKGYWIGHIDVVDHDRYTKYIEGATPAYKAFGAKFLVRGGSYETPEGDVTGSRHVVIEFKDIATARACYNSKEYAAARVHRQAASRGEIMIVEGFDG